MVDSFRYELCGVRTQINSMTWLRFRKLEQEHIASYQKILENVLRQDTAVVSVEAAASTEQADESASTEQAGAAEQVPKVIESVEVLQQGDAIAHRCVSELAGVELIKTSSGKLYAVSEKKRIVPKLTLLGGFGTGKQLDPFTFSSGVQSFCWV